MHVLFWTVATFLFGLLFTGIAIVAGYFVYRARRANERRSAHQAMTKAPREDPLDEYRRLTAEIGTSLGRANDTARSMREAIEKGVR